MASLYDDIEMTKAGGASKWASPAPPPSSLSMMQSHMAARKQTTQARSAAATRTAKASGPTLAPVLDLGRSSGATPTSVEGEYRFNQQTGRLEKVSVVAPSPFIGDPTLSLGVTDEYNPLYPNDYEDVAKRLKEERRARGRQGHAEEAAAPTEARQLVPRRYDSASDEDDEEEEERRIEERKRRPGGGGGAAIAPPPSLVEEPAPAPAFPPPPPKEEMSTSVTASMYGINSVAAKMMAKMGYREGQGLGREGQGMSTALTVEKTSRRGGKIIHERDERQSGMAGSSVPRAEVGNMDALLRKPSKVVLLRNMVGSGEVDDDLQPETAEECSKYGPVSNVMIYELPEASEEEAVRIFVEFESVEAATRAIIDLNGRFFGGRVVKASFYDLDRFINLELGDEVTE